MDNSARKKIIEVLSAHPVVLAYLFGSEARGNTGPLSDVDIAVLFEQEERGDAVALKQLSALSYDLEKAIKTNVDLVDLGAVKSPLLKHRAVKRGELLVSNNDKLRQSFELAVLHEYEDTRHLRQIQSQIMRRQLTGNAL